MAAVTLLEAAKLMEPSRKTGVIQTYAEAYQPMQVAPVIDTGGKASYAWTVEDDLAHTSGGKRNVGSDFTASAGNVKPYESDVKIYGGKIQVDEYIQDHSPASVTFQEASQTRAHAREFTVDLFEGSGGTSLRGWNHWLENDGAFSTQSVNSTSTTENGDLVSLDMMDELVEKISRGNPYLYMRDVHMRRIKRLARGTGDTDQRMVYARDEFGKWAWMYDGIPIVVLKDGKGNDLLSITETDGAGTYSTTGNIYAIDWGIEAAALFSSNEKKGPNGVPLPKVEQHGDGSNYKYIRMTYYVGCVPHTIRCAARIQYCKNATS